MRLFWKIYFWLYLLFVLAGYVAVLSHLEFFPVKWSAVDLLYTAFFLIGLIGLYGFVFGRPLGSRGFWKIVCLLIIGYDLAWYAYWTLAALTDWNILPNQYKTFVFTTLTVLGMTGAFLMAAPFWIALYSYGFRCRDIWNKDSSASA